MGGFEVASNLPLVTVVYSPLNSNGTSLLRRDPKEPGQCLMTLRGDRRPGAPHERVFPQRRVKLEFSRKGGSVRVINLCKTPKSFTPTQGITLVLVMELVLVRGSGMTM